MGKDPLAQRSRGGSGLFSWKNISESREKELYLGASVKGTSAKFAKKKDFEWYKKTTGQTVNKDKDALKQNIKDEIQEVKRLEAEALAAALGYASKITPIPATNLLSNITSQVPETERDRKKSHSRHRNLDNNSPPRSSKYHSSSKNSRSAPY